MADDQQFDWDAANVGHLAEHDVSPLEAESAILDPNAMMIEIQAGEEERVKALGRAFNGRILVVVFTLRGETIRPITAYSASLRLEKIYLEGEPV